MAHLAHSGAQGLWGLRVGFLLLTALSYPAWAQTASSINGVVLDSSGAAIPGVPLVLLNKGTGQLRQASSSVEGYFNFLDLNPGQYSLRVSAQGFKELLLDSVVLTVGRQT